MMSEKDQKDNKQVDDEVLKTFDMYHFFSRKDVILAIIFIIVLLGLIVIMTLPPPATA